MFDRAVDVIRRLRGAGFEAVFAGGCVRDRLLEREPKDYDIATSAKPGDVQRLFPRTVPIGVQYGVVLVVEDGVTVEVATFRSDGAYIDGRHPTAVHFGSAEADAQRRDFTINGLFLDPIADTVIDYVGGGDDLRRGVIRAIGEPTERFREDRLRMLRAVRFAARLGFTIDPGTVAGIGALGATVTDVAWERIGSEIVKILTEGGARRGFELLGETGLLDRVLPEIAVLRGVAQSPEYHPEGDVFVHTLLVLAGLGADATETLALGALLHDVAKPRCAAERDARITFYGHCEQGATMALEICHRLRRSREVTERVAYLVKNHLRLVQAPAMRLSTLKRMLREDGFSELLELARLDALASNGNLAYVEFCEQKREGLGAEAIAPPPLLRGRDLIAMGYAPGRQFAEILEAVESAQLEGEVTTHEVAEAWVRARYPVGGGGAGA